MEGPGSCGDSNIAGGRGTQQKRGRTKKSNCGNDQKRKKEVEGREEGRRRRIKRMESERWSRGGRKARQRER